MGSYSTQITVAVCLLALKFYSSFCAQTLSLRIADGLLKGQVNVTIRKNVTYYNFRGIPYAKPPVGNLRFAAPVENVPWTGTWDATDDRSECIQMGWSSYTVTGSEDCLYINVYTPDINAIHLPVLVWIPTGGFLHLSGNYKIFAPDFFLEQGLVYVSFNYRLGVFGFLSTEDEACPGNAGLKDQILALKWVQRNIASFGGDPGNVTIFGESAGGLSVSLLLQTKLASGLFAKAIMNSGGTSLNSMSVIKPLEMAKIIAQVAGIAYTNSTQIVEGLRKLDAVTLLFKSSVFLKSSFFSMHLAREFIFVPTVEPKVPGAVFIKPIDGALRNGNFNRVNVLMGITSNEGCFGYSIPGTAHAEDVAFFFSNYYRRYAAIDLKVSEIMVLLWSNFAKFGNPTPKRDPALNNTIWPAVNPRSKDFNYLSINESLVVDINPKQEDYLFYQYLWKKYWNSTY